MKLSRKKAIRTFFVSFFTGLYLYVLCFGIRKEYTLNLDIRRINPTGKPPDLDVWLSDKLRACGGNFTGYANEYAWLRWAEVSPSKPGVFAISCKNGTLPRAYPFYNDVTHLRTWIAKLEDLQPSRNSQVVDRMAIAVERYEAHNLYHTMTDWYNIFLFCQLYNISSDEFDVILVDHRPPGHMDETWSVLFPIVYNVRQMNNSVVFKDLVWSVLGYQSPMNHHNLQELPFMDGFYRFFTGAFNINTTRNLNCSNVSVSVIWRRDYMSHPERAQTTGGLMHRKFKNEDEILSQIKTTMKGHKINEIILEKIKMKEQLQIISTTDILIGMHGAGMSHVFFLPSHAGVFELFPNYWGNPQNFEAMSRWRHLKYTSWMNTDDNNEFPNYYTYIPPEVIHKHLSDLYQDMCPASSASST